MSKAAALYVRFVLTVGLWSLVFGLSQWQNIQTPRCKRRTRGGSRENKAREIQFASGQRDATVSVLQ